MAKSLRSKSKRQFRRIKREDPKSVFNAVENMRLANLSSKLKASALKPKALTDAEEYKRKLEGYETEEEGENKDEPAGMQVDGEEAPVVEGEGEGAGSAEKEKVSTSGPRLTRRESYRSDKKFQIRLTRKTEFRAKGAKKVSACKPHRRR